MDDKLSATNSHGIITNQYGFFNYSLIHYVNLLFNGTSYNGISTCESPHISVRPTVLLTARKQTHYNNGWLTTKTQRETWLQYQHCLSSISDMQSVPESALVLHTRVPWSLPRVPSGFRTPGARLLPLLLYRTLCSQSLHQFWIH